MGDTGESSLTLHVATMPRLAWSPGRGDHGSADMREREGNMLEQDASQKRTPAECRGRKPCARGRTTSTGTHRSVGLADP